MIDYLYKLLLGQLQTMGLLLKEKTSISELKAEISGLYHRWLEETIRIAAFKKLLGCNNGTVTHPTIIDIESAWKEWECEKGSWLEDANAKGMVVLVEPALRALPEILLGKVPATDILFPDSSLELVEGIYKNSPLSIYFNEVLANTVAAYVQQRVDESSSAGIRILEIGAGTGGTSAMVFSRLKSHRNHIQEYCYTDISRAFLMHAEKTYARDNPYVTCQLFNVERPIAGQGIHPGGYDLAIAANVLHATRNIRETLRNVKAALKKNGLLLVNEMSDYSLFAHLTFGLLEGWWLYEDAELRIPGCPALYPETWQDILHQEGFGSVQFPAEAAHALGQQIIIAQSDGIVRQIQRPGVSEGIDKKEIKTAVKRPRAVTKPPEPFVREEKHLETKTGVSIQSGLNVTGQMLKNHVATIINECVAEALKMDEDRVQSDLSFSEYGVDSIVAVHLINTINERCGVELQTTVLYDYNNVDQLVGHIIREFGDVLAASLREKIPDSDNPEKSREKSRDVSVGRRLPHQAEENQNRKQRVTHEKTGPVVMGRSSEHPPAGGKPMDRVTAVSRAPSADASPQNAPVAVIGMSARFPKSDNVQELWEQLANGADLVQEVNRWDLSAYYSDIRKEEKAFCNNGGFLEGIDEFDPLFFNISGLEATYMDPQQRLFIEEAWRALEDAGYAGAGVQGRKCGVYVGCNSGDYRQLLENNIPAQGFWGNVASVIPARIAYYLDLQGPAVAIDTACSSSLVAIHIACRELWAGETEMALAGGVYIQSTPDFFIAGGNAGMLSPSGRCYTFDARADGFVPGEGVGVVVLKRLNDALNAGDHIYGVIRGSGINQDGATNGITAPSAKSQERLVRQVYETFNIHAEDIQMVEAHGTATELGDPIEVDALAKAFRKDTDKKQYCAIGSIKTNIGHATMAAGIAGVIKILLALQHRQIPPSLHYQSTNPYIEFEESPFYVNTRLADWNTDADAKRLAVVSAFGFSGTNAHMAIEEAPVIQRSPREKPGYLIVLSARTHEQLGAQVEQLVDYCERHENLFCGDMSYTLLLGRKHLNHRLSCVVRSQRELIRLFRKWLNNKKVLEIYASKLEEHHLKEQPAIKRFGNQCVHICQHTTAPTEYLENLNSIAELYIQGYALAFEKLFSAGQYSRISLPTYPFSKEHYWVQETMKKQAVINSKSAYIHPLLHQNTSDFSAQRYSATFSGQEFFLSDHRINQKRVLPGVACLEMARVAVEQATGVPRDEKTGLRLKNVAWVRPVMVNGNGAGVHIDLYPEEDGRIGYDIYSDRQGSDMDRVVHSRGSADTFSISEMPTIDLSALQAECREYGVSPGRCYELFNQAGVSYGPGHRGIEAIYTGDGKALVKLCLPKSVSGTEKDYVLHPSMLDSALQATMGLIPEKELRESNDALNPSIPFALKELEIFAGCTAGMWALIRHGKGHNEGRTVQELDIDICDDKGNVRVRMKGVTFRLIQDEMPFVTKTPQSIGTLVLQPEWIAKEVDNQDEPRDYTDHIIILLEPGEPIQKEIETQLGSSHCLSLKIQEKEIENRFQTYTLQIFETIKKIIKGKPKGNVLIQVVGICRNEQRLFRGICGLLKTVRLENPGLIGQFIEMESWDTVEDIIVKLEDNSRSPLDIQIRYEQGERQVADIREIGDIEKENRVPWKENGIYLITGGAGGLGLIFAREIAIHCKNAVLILAGRSQAGADKRTRFKELEELGARVIYKPVDMSQKNAVAQLIQDIRDGYGKIDGIIHSAGVVKDNFVLKKSKKDVRAVLSPKVAGLVNLDMATAEFEIDFFVIFSSIVGVMGNLGQADYACANAFMDAYAAYRNDLVASKQRQGQTLSINWPLWREGGMHVDDASREMMQQRFGMASMATGSGVKALYRGLKLKKPQLIVIHGNTEKIRRLIGQNPPHEETRGVIPADRGYGGDFLRAETSKLVKKTISKKIKLPPEKLELYTSFEKYGIDSVMQMDLIAAFEKITGELSKTLLFEYSNSAELVDYFIKNHAEKLSRYISLKKQETEPITTTYGDNPVIGKFDPALRKKRFAGRPEKEKPHPDAEEEKIAIIGIGGRYPQSNGLEELWENLKSGKNCISEFPETRKKTLLSSDYSRSGVHYGGFLENIDRFDNYLFEIRPDRIYEMQPELRLFLEVVWETFEDAGYTISALKDLQERSRLGVGVFTGTMYNQYPWSMPSFDMALLSSNQSDWQIPNRISHFFDLTGPSVAVNSACSSSLTAIHLACESLRQKNCSMAIAGGANLTLNISKYELLERNRLLEYGSKSKSFGVADGYIPGEGVGAALLKPLSEAVLDRDRIYAVINSSFINHCGGRQMYSAPDPKQQTGLICNSIERSGVDPESIGYVESAANGSRLGDSIEVTALQNAFARYTDKKQYCAIGSVKSNLGHLEAASGISQLHKVVLQIKHKTLAPSINAVPRNPNIKFDQTAFYLQEETSRWKSLKDPKTGNTSPVRGLINSFGAGGSYANVIVEEFNPIKGGRKPAIYSRDMESLFLFSAKTEYSLIRYLEKMQLFLERNPEIGIEDIAASLRKINHSLDYKAAVLAGSYETLLEKIRCLIKGGERLDEPGIYTSLDSSGMATGRDPAAGESLLKEKNLNKLSGLWVDGEKIDFKPLFDDSNTTWIDLPKYAFDHSAHVIVGRKDRSDRVNDMDVFQDILTKFNDNEISKESAIAVIQEVMEN